MYALDVRRDALWVRRATVRGAPDGLRARRRLEGALSDVASSGIGLPAQALLVVQRVAPSVPLQIGLADDAGRFGRAVRSDLERSAGRARRPWLDENAAITDAVLFADEAELVACLVRDWLRGRVADLWWWRSLLGDLSPQQWLRQHVLARGEALVPAIAVLAGGPDASAWISRLDDADAGEAIAAIARTHAVSLPISPDEATAPPRTRSDRRGRTDTEIDRRADSRSAALERLIATVPEALAPALRPPQRRLLALALVLTRAPSWARTAQLALALQELDCPSAPADAHAIPEGSRLELPRPLVSRAIAVAEVPPADDKPAHHSGSSDTYRVGGPPLEFEESRPVVRRRTNAARSAIPDVPRDVPEAVARAVARGMPATQAETSQAVLSPNEAPEKMLSIEDAPCVHTQFGGIFYLLNAALAMQLYGDFTAPRGANLKISPWDWLALVGRAWFGREFVRDPVWKLLAGLAGRKRRSLRRPRWLKAQIESLLARLALALGEDRPADIPTLVCRYPSEVAATATRVDVHLALADLPLAIRIAGLDRDPGWIPAAGRSIAFHFE